MHLNVLTSSNRMLNVSQHINFPGPTHNCLQVNKILKCMLFKLERCMVYFKRGVETEIKYFNKIYLWI